MAARLSSALLRTQTDRRLAALAAQGSEPAFEALVERYRRPLQAYCRRLLLDGSTAEDVVQQAFLSTWQALRRGTEIADLKPWLFRVVHNGALNAMQRSGYRHEELTEALSGATAPEEDLDRRIAVRRALAGLAALPDLQREALMRTAVEGRSHEEVARELGVSDSAIRGLVYRARVALRAAATFLTPSPLIAWAAAVASTRNTVPIAERIGEVVAGSGGGAGAAALLIKGGATVAATGALAGGAVVAERTTDRERPATATARTETVKARPPATPAIVRPALASAPAMTPTSTPAAARRGRTADDRAAARRRPGEGRGRDDDRPPRDRRGEGPPPRDDDEHGREDADHRPLGPRPLEDDHRRSGRREGPEPREVEDDDGHETAPRPASGDDRRVRRSGEEHAEDTPPAVLQPPPAEPVEPAEAPEPAPPPEPESSGSGSGEERALGGEALGE